MAAKKKTSRVFAPSELRDIADLVLLYEGWCKSARELLSSQLDKGVKIDGVSLEPTNPSRKWDTEDMEKPDEEIRKLLLRVLKKLKMKTDLDLVAPRSTLSPAQAEKLIGKPAFAEHLSVHAPAKPTGNYSLKLGPRTRTRAKPRSS